ncbi:MULTISPECIES: tryptophanase leader peptide [unclassified Enterobacter]|nr:tryptophanase operon leader peptide [Enterobacter sp. WP_7_1]RMA87517.1 tryptophanase operon leader peptide [Enterobacter sp. WP_7_2]
MDILHMYYKYSNKASKWFNLDNQIVEHHP